MLPVLVASETRMRCIPRCLITAAVYALSASAGPALAEPIIVSNYGVAASAMPYAVALNKGYFKEFGADVDVILDVDGTAAARRLASERIAYAELPPAAVAIAAQRGIGVTIISGNVYTADSYAWITLAASPIGSIGDLRGKRVGYSAEGATTDALNRLALAKAGIAPREVVLSLVGGVVPLLTYLQVKGIEAAPIPEPLRSTVGDGYKTIASVGGPLPSLADAVGVTSINAKVEKRAFIVGVLKARRKAVEYIHEHPVDAAAIIAAVYKTEPAIIERVIGRIIESERTKGQPYWDTGSILRTDPIKAAILAVTDPSGAGPLSVDLSKLIDDSLLGELTKPSS